MARNDTTADSKSLLAKLLAQENITVVHENIEVPFFDLKDRVLHLPIWKEMSGALYNLLVLHEVGHTLDTPPEGWHDAICECKEKHEHVQSCYDLNFKDYLNVCEDARIERRQKDRYPGAKKFFADGYRDLMDRDYFGVKNLRDFSRLTLVDRINLHFKLGAMCPMTFTAEEQKYVARLSVADSWNEVRDVARDIYTYCKKEQSKAPKDQQKLGSLKDLAKALVEQMKQDEKKEAAEKAQKKAEKESKKAEKGDKKAEEAGEKSAKSGEGDQKADEGAEEGNGEGQEGEENSDESDEKSGSGKGAGKEDSGEESKGESDSPGRFGGDGKNTKSSDVTKGAPESVTDKSFRQKERSLLNVKKTVNLILQDVDVKKSNRLISNKRVLEKFERAGAVLASYATTSEGLYRDMISTNRAHINNLITEFNRRKNANQYLREKEHRSGELDTRKMWQYKFREDLFRQYTTMPKGKSHGIVFFLDMSASMNRTNMYCSIEQIIMMSEFCAKMGLPYDVYGFSDAYENGYRCAGCHDNNQRALDINGGTWHILHLVSSRQPELLKRSLAMLAFYAEIHIRGWGEKTNKKHQSEMSVLCESRNGYAAFMQTCGLNTSQTPLFEALIFSKNLILNFKTETKVDIVNVIWLTDGMGNPPNYPTSLSKEIHTDHRQSNDIMVTDEKTKEMVFVKGSGHVQFSIEEAFIRLIKQVTGCRHLGFYIGQAKNVSNYIEEVSEHDHKDNTNGSQYNSGRSKSILARELHENGMACAPLLGFDNYFLVDVKETVVETVRYDLDSKMGVERLGRDFSDQQRRSKATRFLLMKLANDLATTDGLEMAHSEAVRC